MQAAHPVDTAALRGEAEPVVVWLQEADSDDSDSD